MSVLICRWGILGTATISRKNWQAIMRSGNGDVVAVASRERQRAQQFIAESQRRCPLPRPPRALDSYQALLDDDEVDAVYIPLPTGLRKDWVIRAAQAGKHVLCEKPCAVSAPDLLQMIRACDDADVQFMDGVMFMHSRRLPEIQKSLDDQRSFGELRRIASQFSFCADPAFFKHDIRVNPDLEPMGCLGDLGWYTSRMALWAMRGELPLRVRGRMLRSTSESDAMRRVPLEFEAELIFEGGVTARLYNSFVTHHQQWVHFSGTRGTLAVEDFVLPYYGNTTSFRTQRCDFNPSGWDFNMERYPHQHEVAEFSNANENCSETQLIRTFNQLVIERRVDPRWPEWSYKTQVILDACMRSARSGGEEVAIEEARRMAV